MEDPVRAASREGDFQVCPQVTGQYHLGGPIQTGARDVRVEGAPAARLADLVRCQGAETVLSSGAREVLIHGRPAVAVGDATLHGGHAGQGAREVYVGGPTFSVPKNVAIEGDLEFQSKVVRDLYFLSTTRTGAAILERIARSGKPFEIRPAKAPHYDSENGIHPELEDSIIYYNTERFASYTTTKGEVSVPPQVGLAHELIHGIHHAEGRDEEFFVHDANGHYDKDGEGKPIPTKDDLLGGATWKEQTSNCESAAIGIGSYREDRMPSTPTENDLLQDLGLPQRVSHEGKEATVHGPNPRP